MATSKAAEFLESQGWRMSSRKKQGCMWIVRWGKPGTNWHGLSQGQAYLMARADKKWREQEAGRVSGESE